MKILYLLLVFALSFGTIGINAQDNYRTDDPPIETDTWLNTWLSFNYEGIDWDFLRFHYKPDDVDAYCIEHGVEMYPDSDYSVEDYNQEKLQDLAKIYYAVVDLGDSDLHYMAAQLMIWEMFGHPKIAKNEPNIKRAIAEINAKIKEYDKAIAPALEFKAEAEIGKLNIIEDKNKVLAKGYEIDSFSEGISDVRIVNNQIEYKIDNPNIEKLEIAVKPSAKLLAENQFDQGKVYIATSSQTLFSYNAKIPVNYAKAKINYEFKHGSLIIEKYDEDEHLITEDIGIDLYTTRLEGSKLVCDKKVNNQPYLIKNGQLTIPNLAYGSYIIKEVSCPDNLVLENKDIIIDINQQSVNYHLINKYKRGSLIIHKYDDEDQLVKDSIGIDLYRTKLVNGQYVEDEKINASPYISYNGEIRIDNLKYGRYLIKEVIAPDNFEINPEVFNVDINEVEINYNLVNKLKRGSILIHKYDSDDNLVLDEVGIDLYSSKLENGVLVADQKLNPMPYMSKAGVIRIDNLKYGTYFIKEVIAPNNQSLNLNMLQIDLNQQEITYKLVNDLKLGSLIIHKYDNEGKRVFKEIAVDLYRSKIVDGMIVKDQKVNDYPYVSINGVIQIANLKYGTYILKEVSCPDEYHLNENEIKIDINEASVSYKLVNDLKYGNIIINKYDSDNKPVLEEVGIDLYSSKLVDGRLVYDQKLNDSPYMSVNGEIRIDNLKYGTYFIKEVIAPANQDLNPNYIQIDLNQTNYHYKLINDLKVGSLIIYKYDNEGRKVKDEITIDLYNGIYVDGKYIKGDKYNEAPLVSIDGVIKIPNLKYGHYILKEVSCPDNFHLNETEIEIEISEASTSYNLVNELKYGSIVIHKYDNEGNQVFAEVGVDLYSSKLENGLLVADTKLNDQSYLSKDGVIEINNLKYGTYFIKEVIAPANQTLISHYIQVDVDKEVITYKLVNQLNKGSIVIEKFDSEHQLVSDIVGVDLYNTKEVNGRLVPNQKLNDTPYLSKNGVIRIDGLNYGHYFIKEVIAPDHLSIYPLAVEINLNASEIHYQLINDLKRGNLTIEKYDNQNNIVLEEVELKLYTTKFEDGKFIKDKLVNNQSYKTIDGRVTITDLKYGTYLLEELSCPDHLVLKNELVEIKVDDVNVTYQLVNEIKTGSLLIYKYDSDKQVVLEEVGIDLYSSKVIDGELKPDKKINFNPYMSKDGVIRIDNLDYGKYFIKEVIAPSHLEINKDYIEIDFNQTEVEYKLYNKIKEAEIIIHKEDQDNHQALANVGFKIYDVSQDQKDIVADVYLASPDSKLDLSKLVNDNEELYLAPSDYYHFENNTLSVNDYNVIDVEVLKTSPLFKLNNFETIYSIKGGKDNLNDDLAIYVNDKLIETEISLDEYMPSENSKYNELVYRFSYNNHEYLIKRYLSYESDLEFETKVYELVKNVRIYVGEDLALKDELKPLVGSLKAEVKTNKNGQAEVLDLKMKHDYLVCEADKLNAYSYDSACKFIKTNKVINEMTIQNSTKNIDLIIHKVNASKQQLKLNGAVFEFKQLDANNKIIKSSKYISGALHLEPADFKHANEVGLQVEVEGHKYPLNDYVNIENLKAGNYEVKLLNQNDEVIQTIFKELNDGEIHIEHLKYGDHIQVQEMKAPIGYEIDDHLYDFVVKTGDQFATIEQYRVNNIIVIKTAA